MLKVRFLKKVKKIKFLQKIQFLFAWQGSNPGPLAPQSNALTTIPWRKLEIAAIFHLYISNICKNQLTLKKTTASQTNFGFTNTGSKMLRFRGRAI